MFVVKNNKDYWIVIIIAFIVALINLGLIDILPYNNTTVAQSLNDFLIIAVTGCLGVAFAGKSKLPVWTAKISENKKHNLGIILLGFIAIAVNTIIFINSQQQALEVSPWLNQLTPLSALIISIRAALTEEIIFRLFFISAIMLFINKFMSSTKVPLILGVIIASVIFGSIHPGFLLAFVYGVVLSYIYINSGLIMVFIIHFFADFIPFLLVALG